MCQNPGVSMAIEPPQAVLVPPGDEERFIRAEFVLRREMSNQLQGGKPNLQCFEEHFSWSRIGRRYMHALTTVG